MNPMRLSLFFLFSLLLPLGQSQTSPPNNASPGCNGVQLTYSLTARQKIRPFLTDPKAQPYSFKATATVLNSGIRPIKNWALLIHFQHDELIVSASNSVLNNNSPFPFNTSDSAGSPASFSGFPNTDLKTPIETAGDLSQIQAQIDFVGTLFGSPPPAVPLPKTISLDDPLLRCPQRPPNSSASAISVCCVPNPNPNLNNTAADNDTDFLPRRSGDLSIFYDVLQSYGSSYLTQVTISNDSPLGRLDSWRLSWEWMRGEFIFSLKGAYASLVDSASCILGQQGQYYQEFDFSKAVTCVKKPVILDLPVSKFNDTDVGKIPFCCRNGTILPEMMDPSQTKSAFQMQVFKMPPDLNRTKVFPPENWKITGGLLNPSYQCGQPIRVAPTLFPDPSGLASSVSAVATWQVVCNITKPKGAKPKCCVSFSAFYNDSVVPCNTCACGCPARVGKTCNASAPAMLQPPQALLVPFDNRTEMTRYFAALKHYNVPNPMPCGDYCGVSINWHVNSDFRSGWTARVTLFNWEDASFADWFAAVEMGKAYDGYEGTYSFNGTAIGNNTIFMEGLPGLNYLVGETDGANPATDPRVPGKQQTVISFTKKNTPGIDVVAGDGFPKKVFFNGEECSLPDMFLTSRGFRNGVGGVFSLVLVLVAAAVVLMLEL